MSAISIIVPVYNVERYLKTCMDSICEQNFADVQVICVDDCSTDASYQILKQYEKEYEAVEVYRNDTNMGLAYTRNTGLKYARGKYIVYVDSDDFLAQNSLASIYEHMECKNLDILFFDVEEFDEENHEMTDRRIRKHSYTIASGIELIKDLIKNDEMFGCVWDAIYRREYLEENELTFINGILHEDIAYTFAAVLNARRASCLNQTVYYYRQRKGSILHNPDYAKLLKGLTLTYSAMLLTWNDFLYRNECSDEISLYIMQYMDSITRLMRSRYRHIEITDKTDTVIQSFFGNFIFNKKKILQNYFRPDDFELIEKMQNILIYGAGETAAEVIPILKECGIGIAGVYVTDASENVQRIYDIPIEHYKKINFNAQAQCMVIAVAETAQAEIVELLQQNHFSGSIVKVKKG